MTTKEKIEELERILEEANTMNDTFHPDEVPSHLKEAARECQCVRRGVERRLLGGLPAESLLDYPTLPKPAMDGQVLHYPVYNSLSGQHIANLIHIAIGGVFHLVGRRDLTAGQSWGILNP